MQVEHTHFTFYVLFLSMTCTKIVTYCLVIYGQMYELYLDKTIVPCYFAFKLFSLLLFRQQLGEIVKRVCKITLLNHALAL